MIDLKKLEVWFITGTQHLYGEETLKQVAEHSKEIANAYTANATIPVDVVFKPTVKTSEEIHAICKAANNDDNCIGIITWMHTFSPSKMWIAGLTALQKPFLHLHTQFNRDIPWNSIDMDFMLSKSKSSNPMPSISGIILATIPNNISFFFIINFH